MGNNYSNEAKAIDQKYCELCRGLTNHRGKNHVCSKCKQIGDHCSKKHGTCRYCTTVDHFSTEHRCEECGQNHSKHIHKNELCLFCGGNHDKKYHTCSICNKIGHEKSEDDHDQCKLCQPPKRFTHKLFDHVDFIDQGSLTCEETKNFRHCFHCQKIIYVEDNLCSNCKKEIDENIICRKQNGGCGHVEPNRLINVCPICGLWFSY